MRRLLVVILPILAVLAACSSASSAPGWTYAPAPSATPVASGGASGAPEASGAASAGPSAAPSEAPSAAASAAAPSAGASGGPGGSGAPGASGAVLTVTAPVGAATAGYVEKTLSTTANTPFTVHFDNQDNQAPHNFTIKDGGGTKVQLGGDTAFFTGPGTRDLQVPALKTGTYTYYCEVHPSTMIGTLTVQ